jgi:hypothetical protein
MMSLKWQGERLQKELLEYNCILSSSAAAISRTKNVSSSSSSTAESYEYCSSSRKRRGLSDLDAAKANKKQHSDSDEQMDPEGDMDRVEFIRKRNALYSRRKYHRKKIEIEVMQKQAMELRAKNNEQRREIKQLEMILNSAKSQVATLQSGQAYVVTAAQVPSVSMFPIRQAFAPMVAASNVHVPISAVVPRAEPSHPGTITMPATSQNAQIQLPWQPAAVPSFIPAPITASQPHLMSKALVQLQQSMVIPPTSGVSFYSPVVQPAGQGTNRADVTNLTSLLSTEEGAAALIAHTPLLAANLAGLVQQISRPLPASSASPPHDEQLVPFLGGLLRSLSDGQQFQSKKENRTIY